MKNTFLMKAWHILLPIVFLGTGAISVAQTLSTKNPGKKSDIKLFENVTLAPKFTPTPIVLRGISGGVLETQQFSLKDKTETGECIGFVDETPDHEITLVTNFDSLKMSILSSGDTILLVKGPGGVWCADDSTDRNPQLLGQWLAGNYQIWVGSYESNATHPYILELSETLPTSVTPTRK